MMMSRRAAPLLAGALLLGGVLALFGSVLVGLVRQWWTDENYSHGFLILPLVMYFVWERRHRLAVAAPHPTWAGLGVVFASLGVFAVGSLGAELFLARVSLLGVLAGLVLFVLGPRHLRILGFPLAFLLLMIPLPAIVFNQVAFPLQLLASRAGEAAVAMAGIPVLREGNVITLANTTLEVAEACSGVRSLISLLTLAIVLGYFADNRLWARLVLAVTAIPVAILANAARVAGTGIAAHFYGAEAAQGFLHTFSGWLVFLVAFVLLLSVQRVLKAIGTKASAKTRGATGGVASRAPRPGVDSGRAPTLSWLSRTALATACLLFAAVAVARASHGEPTPARRSLSQFPATIGAWREESAQRFDAQTLDVLRVDEYVSRIYSAPGAPPVGLYIGFYRSQRQGDTIHSPLNCLPGAGWEPVGSRRMALDVPVSTSPTADRRRIVVNQIVVQKGLDRQVVLYWYQSHGRVTASEYWGKAYMIFDAIRLNRTDAALVRVISPVAADDQSAEAASRQASVAFARAMFPLLSEYLPD